MHFINTPFTLTKAAEDTGAFEGYAAIFGNVDLGGDVIEPGAFQEIVRNDDGKVVILLEHGRMSLPIGLAEVGQDERGLWFKGGIVMDDPEARRVHTHMRAKTLQGMSIGYDIMPGGAEIMDSGVRKLKALRLWEISPVVWGMNPQARIEAVKKRPRTVREYERALRELGFSDAEAVALASTFKGLKQPGEPGPGDPAIAESVQRLAERLKGVRIHNLQSPDKG